MKTDGGKVKYRPWRRIEVEQDIVSVDPNSVPTSRDKICDGSKRSSSGPEGKESMLELTILNRGRAPETKDNRRSHPTNKGKTRWEQTTVRGRRQKKREMYVFQQRKGEDEREDRARVGEGVWVAFA